MKISARNVLIEARNEGRITKKVSIKILERLLKLSSHYCTICSIIFLWVLCDWRMKFSLSPQRNYKKKTARKACFDESEVEEKFFLPISTKRGKKLKKNESYSHLEVTEIQYSSRMVRRLHTYHDSSEVRRQPSLDSAARCK